MRNEVQQRLAFGRPVDALDAHAQDRLAAFQREVLTAYLDQPSGTLVVMLGVSDQSFQQLLRDLDQAELQYTRDSGRKNLSQQGEDWIELISYLQLRSPLAQPFHREALKQGGFNRDQIGMRPRLFFLTAV